jgi:hypothetical protein
MPYAEGKPLETFPLGMHNALQALTHNPKAHVMLCEELPLGEVEGYQRKFQKFLQMARWSIRYQELFAQYTPRMRLVKHPMREAWSLRLTAAPKIDLSPLKNILQEHQEKT